MTKDISLSVLAKPTFPDEKVTNGNNNSRNLSLSLSRICLWQRIYIFPSSPNRSSQTKRSQTGITFLGINIQKSYSRICLWQRIYLFPPSTNPPSQTKRSQTGITFPGICPYPYFSIPYPYQEFVSDKGYISFPSRQTGPPKRKCHCGNNISGHLSPVNYTASRIENLSAYY